MYGVGISHVVYIQLHICMRTVINVQNNLKEILEFLEEKGYKWFSGNKPTDGMNWSSKFIIIEDKTLTHLTMGHEPNSITLEQFKEKTIMKTNKVLPGYKLVLENGNTFIVREYKNVKIVFPEGSSRSVISLDELCNIDLTPKSGASRIVKVFNNLNILIWERKFTRSEIKAGFTMTNENGVNYLIVENDCNLRIMSTELFVVGPKLRDIMNEDMSPTDSDYAEVIEVRDKEGKVVYSKK
jgi:hypothetical protein